MSDFSIGKPPPDNQEEFSIGKPLDKPPMTWGEAGELAIKNAPSSAASTGKSMISPILHPIDTAEDIYHLGAGITEEALGLKGDDKRYVSAIKEYYKDRYGSEQGFKKALANDPVGVMTDLATVFSGGELAVGKLGKVGEVASTAAKVTNPIERATSIAKTAGKYTASTRAKIANALVTKGAKLLPQAAEARAAGYAIPPTHMAENPGLISRAMNDFAGDARTSAFASQRNQEVTQRLTKQALGLNEHEQFTPQKFDNIRKEAGKAYEDVEKSIPMVYANQDFENTVKGLGQATSEAAKYFPEYMHNPKIAALSKELSNTTSFSPRAGLEMVKKLRFNSNEHLHMRGDPSANALGLAEREAADAIDKLIGENISAFGSSKDFDTYQAARKQIAMSYDIEAATNPATGLVDASKLGALYRAKRPFTGPLETVAKTALAFPQATQRLAKVAGAPNLSQMDFFEALGATAVGHPGVAATILAKPAIRSSVLSEKMQNRIAGVPNKPKEPFLTDKGKQALKKVAPASYQLGQLLKQLQGNFQ